MGGAYVTLCARDFEKADAAHNRAAGPNRDQTLKRARTTPISHHLRTLEAMENLFGMIPIGRRHQIEAERVLVPGADLADIWRSRYFDLSQVYDEMVAASRNLIRYAQQRYSPEDDSRANKLELEVARERLAVHKIREEDMLTARDRAEDSAKLANATVTTLRDKLNKQHAINDALERQVLDLKMHLQIEKRSYDADTSILEERLRESDVRATSHSVTACESALVKRYQNETAITITWDKERGVEYDNTMHTMRTEAKDRDLVIHDLRKDVSELEEIRGVLENDQDFRESEYKFRMGFLDAQLMQARRGETESLRYANEWEMEGDLRRRQSEYWEARHLEKGDDASKEEPTPADLSPPDVDINRAGSEGWRERREQHFPGLDDAEAAPRTGMLDRLMAIPAAAAWAVEGDLPVTVPAAEHGAVWRARFDDLSSWYESLAIVSRRLVSCANLEARGTTGDGTDNAAALRVARTRIAELIQQEARSTAELVRYQAHLNEAWEMRDQARETTFDHDNTIATQRIELETLRDRIVQMNAVHTFRTIGFEARLRERSRLSAGQVVSSERASVLRYRAEAQAARAMLRTRTAELNERHTEMRQREQVLLEDLADLRLRHDRACSRMDSMELEIEDQAKVLEDTEEELNSQVMDARRHEVISQYCLADLKELRRAQSTAPGRSDDPALNRAGGGPRRPGYTGGPISNEDISQEELRTAQGILITQSLAPGTHRTYSSHDKQWLAWREVQNLSPLLDPAIGPIKMEQEVINHYVFYGMIRKLAVKTMHVRLYAIKRLHLVNGIELDFAKMPQLRLVMRGFKRVTRGPRRKLAISVKMLRDLVTNKDLDPAKWDDMIQITAVLFGFFFLLRSSEYLRTEHGVDEDKCVRIEHLTFYRNNEIIDGAGPLHATRVRLFLPFSKTSTTDNGVSLVLDADPGNILCPIQMCNALRSLKPHRFRECEGHKHIFATANGTVLHKEKLQHHLKNAAASEGFNPADFTSHSLRAGGASAMYHNGFSAEEIQRRGRWVSDVWKVYIQGNSEGAEAMTRRMSTNSTMLHDRLKGAWAA